MIRRVLVSQLAGLFLLAVATAEPRAVVPPDAPELKAQVEALAAPEMEGRGSGTPGGERAERYIADRLAAWGLRPGGDAGSFRQSFVFATGVVLGAGSALERLGAVPLALQAGRDWTPHGGSLGAEVSGEIVFVGHGVAAAGGRDDWAGADVSGRIALALDGGPPRAGGLPSSRIEKLIAARRHGAAALLIVGDALPSLEATGAAVRVVSGTITPAAADLLLGPSGRTLAELRASHAGPVATGVRARLRVDLGRQERRTANVIGVLPGTDPARAGEVVVLGAHYDHLGRVGGAVHPGADDNASGTSLVLGLAQSFAAAGGAPRTLVFALFSGEEEGLLGSSHYVRHPTFPLAATVAMLNFDMVGRMRDGRLEVSGVESGTGLRALVSSAGGASVALVVHDSPFAPSDHTPFYRAGAPVLFFFTGSHEEYHTPRDTPDRIDGQGMAEVARIAARVVERLAGEPRPVYVVLSPSAQTAERGAPPDGAFLGVSVGGRGGSDGLSLSSVLPGTGAARAGLANGDVIVQLGDQPIDSFEELRRALADRRPGDSVSIVYLRDGVDYRTTATLGTRP